MAEAVDEARRHPMAPFGSVEVGTLEDSSWVPATYPRPDESDRAVIGPALLPWSEPIYGAAALTEECLDFAPQSHITLWCKVI